MALADYSTLYPGPSNPGASTSGEDQPDAQPLPLREADKSGVDALRQSGASWDVPTGQTLPGTLNSGSGHHDRV